MPKFGETQQANKKDPEKTILYKSPELAAIEITPLFENVADEEEKLQISQELMDEIKKYGRTLKKSGPEKLRKLLTDLEKRKIEAENTINKKDQIKDREAIKQLNNEINNAETSIILIESALKESEK